MDLITSPQVPGQTYTVTISGVKDQMLPASTIIFGAWALAKGLIRFEHYDNLSGASNSAITTALADPRVVAGKPTTLGVLTGSFDTRSVSPNDSHENYLARMTGFITSTETAEYHFFVAYDDASRVYLSKDETAPDPAVDTPFVDEPACCTFAEPDSGKPVTTAGPSRSSRARSTRSSSCSRKAAAAIG